MDQACPYTADCCTGCWNDLSDGIMTEDEFEFGCCDHRPEDD